MGPNELRKIAIQREGMEEKVNRAWWTVCAVVSHDFRPSRDTRTSCAADAADG